MASVLESNRVLEHLVLNTCDLRDEGMEPIANGEWNRGESRWRIRDVRWRISRC